MEIDPIVLSYLAGIIDGEGSIFIHQNNKRQTKANYTLYLSCKMAVPGEAIVLLSQTFGGNITHPKLYSTFDRNNRKLTVSWRSTGERAAEALTLMLPYLRVKKAEAELGLEFLAAKVNSVGRQAVSEEEITKREDFCKRMQDLKYSG